MIHETILWPFIHRLRGSQIPRPRKKKKIATLSESVPFELISPIMKAVFSIKEIINSHNSSYTERNSSEDKRKVIK